MSPRRRPSYPLGLRLRTAVSRRHRLLAAALCAVALTVLVLAFAPPTARTVPVLTAARNVPAGQRLAPEDPAVAQFPQALAPQNTLSSADEAMGRAATVALSPGQPVTAAGVLGPGLLAGQPAGTTAATARVSAPASLQHIRPGDRVDVVHHPADSSAGKGVSVASGVAVLWTAPDDRAAGTSLLSSSSDDAAGLVVLAADRETAARLASLEGSGRIALVLVS